MKKIKWTKEKCLVESLKYKSRTEFYKKSPSVYNSSIKYGWLDEICSHMVGTQKPNNYWTKEKCQEEALKYNSRKDFNENCVSAYNKCRNNMWLNEICSHMIELRKPNNYWTKDRCQEEALKYNSRKEFENENKSAYMISFNNKWLNDICKHMVERKKPKEYWTKEKCQEEALKYQSRSEFYKNCVASYSKSWENNWLDEICSHMVTMGNKYKRCIYVYEFSETKTAYVGLTYDIKNRNSQHLKFGPVYEYFKKNGYKPLLKQLTEYLDVNDSKLKEKSILIEYINNNWNVLNIAKTGATGGGTRKWTKEKCIEDAKKYKTKTEYRNSLSYRASTRNKWLDEIYKECNFQNE